jgi:hypothetical protein
MDERPDAMNSPTVDGVAVLTEAFGAHNAEERGLVSSSEEELDDLERSLNNEDLSDDEFSSNGTNIKKRKRDGDDSVDGLTAFAVRICSACSCGTEEEVPAFAPTRPLQIFAAFFTHTIV